MPVYRRLLARAGPNLAALQEVVEQFRTGVAHFHVKGVYTAREVVERPDGRNGHEQADSSGYEGFRNTTGNGADARRLLRRHRLERVDDADDGTEQTDERSSRADGCQSADATLQFGVNNGLGTLKSALGRFNFFTRYLRSTLVRLKFLQTGYNNLCKMALLVAIGDLDRLIELAFAQRASDRRCERTALFARRVESHCAIDHNADRPCRHNKHEDNDGFRQRSHLLPKVAEIPSRSPGFLQQHKSPYLHL